MEKPTRRISPPVKDFVLTDPPLAGIVQTTFSGYVSTMTISTARTQVETACRDAEVCLWMVNTLGVTDFAASIGPSAVQLVLWMKNGARCRAIVAAISDGRVAMIGRAICAGAGLKLYVSPTKEEAFSKARELRDEIMGQR